MLTRDKTVNRPPPAERAESVALVDRATPGDPLFVQPMGLRAPFSSALMRTLTWHGKTPPMYGNSLQK